MITLHFWRLILWEVSWTDGIVPVLLEESWSKLWASLLKQKYIQVRGIPRWFSGKESTCNAGDPGDASSIPGSERPSGGGNGNPLQYSCQEKPMKRGLVCCSTWFFMCDPIQLTKIKEQSRRRLTLLSFIEWVKGTHFSSTFDFLYSYT